MKPVLQLSVDEKTGAFAWQFAPEVDSTILSPFTLAAAVLRLQTIANRVLEGGQGPKLETADQSLLNMLKRRQGT